MDNEKTNCRYWIADELCNVKATFSKIVFCDELEDRPRVYRIISPKESSWKEPGYLYVACTLLLFPGYYAKEKSPGKSQPICKKNRKIVESHKGRR